MDGVSNSVVVLRRTSPPTPSTTAGQHQPLGALAGEDGLGTTNDGCGGRKAAYSPPKGVGYLSFWVLLGEGGWANENLFDSN